MRSLFILSSAGCVLLMIGNLVILNIYTLHFLPEKLEALAKQAKPIESSIPPTCDDACQESIANRVRELLPTPAVSTVSTTVLKNLYPQPTPAQPREFYIPLGTGKTTSAEWEDVAGSDTYIDTRNFPPIKDVFFEASLHIPTKNGVVSARLYNVTDAHPVWFSEISTDQDTPTFVNSPSVRLDTGNKRYRVQLKTTLRFDSVLSGSKLKIITQ